MFAGRFSVVKNSQVARDYLVFQKRTGRNIDPLSVVGYDDYGALQKEEMLSES